MQPSAGASEVVLLDREPLALQCALMSALATCSAAGIPADVQGLRLDGTQSHGINKQTGAPSPSSGAYMHPSQSLFHGPDVQRYVEGSMYLAGRNKGMSAGAAPPTLRPTPGVIRGQVFDWTAGPEPLLAGCGGRRFDVVLACDVLYEKEAVQPIASLVPGCVEMV
jgi:hypothetical protein